MWEGIGNAWIASCFAFILSFIFSGKYTGLSDAYLSVIKSLQHACMDARFKLKVWPGYELDGFEILLWEGDDFWY